MPIEEISLEMRKLPGVAEMTGEIEETLLELYKTRKLYDSRETKHL